MMQNELQVYLKNTEVSATEVLDFLQKYPTIICHFEETPPSGIDVLWVLNNLEKAVRIMLQNDLEPFFQLMYTMDIPEHVTKKVFFGDETGNPETEMASLVYQRIKIKILTRRFYSL